MSRWVRLTFAVLAAAIVWLVASRAEASAPRCDSRGAITFAPPPRLEEPNRSVDIAPPDLDCLNALFGNGSVDRGRSPPAGSDALTIDAAPIADCTAVSAPWQPAPKIARFEARDLGEHKLTLERPPRA